LARMCNPAVARPCSRWHADYLGIRRAREGCVPAHLLSDEPQPSRPHPPAVWELDWTEFRGRGRALLKLGHLVARFVHWSIRQGGLIAMATTGDVFRPGQEVPQSGFYECDAGDKHSWSVNVRGHRFPPLPGGCKGGGWVLKNTTAAAEALHGVSQAIPGVETSRQA